MVLANAGYTVTGHRRALLNITCSVTGNGYELLAIASEKVTGHRRAQLAVGGVADLLFQSEV